MDIFRSASDHLFGHKQKHPNGLPSNGPSPLVLCKTNAGTTFGTATVGPCRGHQFIWNNPNALEHKNVWDGGEWNGDWRQIEAKNYES
jgi:hypothetical protein